jgi:hypothetical protein
MTTGEIPPSTSSTEMRAIWQVDNTDERTKAIKKQWPAFADEFVEMLADVFCRQGLRISMETLKNDFADVQIYC